MAVRITPPLDKTEELLKEILKVILVDEQRVSFLVPAGTAYHVCARIRTMISRKRGKLQARGVNPKRFTLMSTEHPETHDGKRYDCIVMWKQVYDSHLMTEQLEDMLAND